MTTPLQRIDELTIQAAKRHGVPAQSDGRIELASHLHDAARDLASGQPVTAQHVDAAWETLRPQVAALLGTADGPAADAPGSHDPVTRKTKDLVARFTTAPAPVAVAAAASWGPRFIAYLADVLAVGLTISLSIALLESFWFGFPGGAWRIFDVLIPLIVAGVTAAYVAFEVYRGATPGKMLMGLRTIDGHGQTPSWQQAILVTLPKAIPPLIVLDSIVGYAINKTDRQRWTQRWAEVRVVRRHP